MQIPPIHTAALRRDAQVQRVITLDRWFAADPMELDPQRALASGII